MTTSPVNHPLVRVGQSFYGIDTDTVRHAQRMLSWETMFPQEEWRRLVAPIKEQAQTQGIQVGPIWTAFLKSGPRLAMGLFWTNHFANQPEASWTLAILSRDLSDKMFSANRVPRQIVMPHLLGILSLKDSGVALAHFISASYMKLEGIVAEHPRLSDPFEGINVDNPWSRLRYRPSTPEDALRAKSVLELHHEYVACRTPLVEEENDYLATGQESGPLRKPTEPKKPAPIFVKEVHGRHGGYYQETIYSDGTKAENFG